jgi:hypothetical protein
VNFVEFLTHEVRRIPLLSTWVNKGKRKGQYPPFHYALLVLTRRSRCPSDRRDTYSRLLPYMQSATAAAMDDVLDYHQVPRGRPLTS